MPDPTDPPVQPSTIKTLIPGPPNLPRLELVPEPHPDMAVTIKQMAATLELLRASMEHETPTEPEVTVPPAAAPVAPKRGLAGWSVTIGHHALLVSGILALMLQAAALFFPKYAGPVGELLKLIGQAQ
jgi:uncharacterized membrane protein YcfT